MAEWLVVSEHVELLPLEHEAEVVISSVDQQQLMIKRTASWRKKCRRGWRRRRLSTSRLEDVPTW